MKTKYLLAILSLAITVASCQLETSGNGDLDGMWKMTSVDTLSNNGTLDLSGKRMFWSVQSRLLQLNDADGICSQILMRFNHTGDSLILSKPYGYDREDGDTILTDLSRLTPYGVNDSIERFKIIELNSSKMSLQTTKIRIHFVRY